MEITLDKKSSTEAYIKIKLKEVDYQPKVDEKVREYSKKAQLKGFRAGKVPGQVIRNMYGKSILVEEINQLLSTTLSDYIKENNLKIIGEPLPDLDKAREIDWDNQKDFEFEYSIGLIDDFELNISPKQKVKQYEIEVDDKSLEETITELKSQFGTMLNPETSEEGDSLYGELRAQDGDFKKDIVLPINLVAKKEKKKFIGISSGAVLSFELGKLFNSKDDILGITGLEPDAAVGMHDFELKNVNRTQPAEMNQDFFDKVLGKDAVKSEKEFKERLSEYLVSNYERDSESYLNTNIRDLLIEQNKMEIPEEFLKNWLRSTSKEKITDEDLENNFDTYTSELKWNILTNSIAEKFDLKVEHHEIMDHTKNMIRAQFGGSSDQLEENMDSFADNYLQGNEGQNYVNLANQLRMDKIFTKVKEEITLQPKKITAQEFRKMVSK